MLPPHLWQKENHFEKVFPHMIYDVAKRFSEAFFSVVDVYLPVLVEGGRWQANDLARLGETPCANRRRPCELSWASWKIWLFCECAVGTSCKEQHICKSTPMRSPPSCGDIQPSALCFLGFEIFSVKWPRSHFFRQVVIRVLSASLQSAVDGSFKLEIQFFWRYCKRGKRD